MLWVPEILSPSCDLGVFVDQAAEPVAPQNPDFSLDPPVNAECGGYWLWYPRGVSGVFALLLTVLQRVRGSWAGAGGVPCGVGCGPVRGWSGRSGGRPAGFCPQVQPCLFMVMARGQVEDEVPATAPGGAGAGGDETAADRGGAGLRERAAGEGPGGAQQVMGHGGDDEPGGVRGEDARREVGEGAGVQVGVDLLDDGVAAIRDIRPCKERYR